MSNKIFNLISPLIVILLLAMFISCESKEPEEQMELAAKESIEKIGDEYALVIRGVLVDEDDKPMAGQKMFIYANAGEKTIETKLKKGETVKKVEGTGKINFSIKGIKEGGAIKLIDGIPQNPHTETNQNGEFEFMITKKFIEGEEALILTREVQKALDTERHVMVDNNGNPIKLIPNTNTTILDLGNIKTLNF